MVTQEIILSLSEEMDDHATPTQYTFLLQNVYK